MKARELFERVKQTMVDRGVDADCDQMKDIETGFYGGWDLALEEVKQAAMSVEPAHIEREIDKLRVGE